MMISVFDLFKVGIGPSSSHTVGPMKAARMFAEGLARDGLTPQVRAVRVAVYGWLRLLGEHEIGFTVAEHLEFNRRKKLSYHPNGMRFTACDDQGAVIRERAYYSVGGGFVVDEAGTGSSPAAAGLPVLPYPFTTGAGLLAHTARSGLPISGIMLENEQALGKTAAAVRADLGDLWQVMRACVERGCRII